ncbi:MAG: uracil-DNA glycosylase, partial [Bacteroidia bacterium]|nr:uracil-DNA glycosylase [Bacteroidia bacterium]
MDIKIEASWKERLHDEFEKPYFTDLTSFVRSEYAMQKIYPPG